MIGFLSAGIHRKGLYITGKEGSDLDTACSLDGFLYLECTYNRVFAGNLDGLGNTAVLCCNGMENHGTEHKGAINPFFPIDRLVIDHFTPIYTGTDRTGYVAGDRQDRTS